MNVLSLISGILFTLFIVLGVHVILIDRKSIAHRLFFIICLVLAYIEFVATFTFSATVKAEILIWYRMAMVPYMFFFPLLIHFVLQVTGLPDKRSLPALLFYLPGIPFLIVLLSGSFIIYKDFIREGGIWVFLPDYESIMPFLFIAYAVIYYLGAMALVIWWGIRAGKKRIKRQALLLGLAFLSIPLFGISENMLLPVIFPGYRSPGLGPLWFAFWAIGAWLALVKYKFLSLTPELAGRDIAAHIDEAVILLDTDRRILKVNEKTEELTGARNVDAAGAEFSLFLDRPDRLDGELKNMLAGKTRDFTCRLDMKKADGSKLLMDTRFSLFTDRFDEPLGVLVLGREVKELKQLKAFYRLTARETELIQCLIDGASHREIADLLGIAERTVKAHVGNIYGKLGVESKGQLFSLLKNYKIVSGYQASKAVVI